MLGFQHKVFLVPKDQFTMEYVEPKVHCISTHGQFSPDRYKHLNSPVETALTPDLTWYTVINT